MSVTRIRYDERQFRSAEQCLSEIASRLERGWTLSRVGSWHGRIRAVFAWREDQQQAESGALGAAAEEAR